MNRPLEDYSTTQRRWADLLRKRGISAAHPEDGWVDREKNTIQFVHPSFYIKSEVGDYVAIGDPRDYRIVRIIGKEPLRFRLTGAIPDFRYYFRDTNKIPVYDRPFTKWCKKHYGNMFNQVEFEFWIKWGSRENQRVGERIFLSSNIGICQLEQLCDAFARHQHYIHNLYPFEAVWAWRKIPT